MKLKAMTLAEHPEEGSIPETITVEMTAREAVYIGKLLDKQNGLDAEEVISGGDAESTEIYNCLTGEVANRFFDNGLDDWAQVVSRGSDR